MVARRGTGSGQAGDITVLDHILALLAELDIRYRLLLAEMDLRYQQRFDAQSLALSAALLSAEKAVQTALATADRAVIKAETATEKRFDAVNEFRAAYQDVISQQMPRAEAEQRLSALAEKVNEVKEIAGTQRDRGLGLNAGWAYLLGAVGLIGGVVSLVLAFAGRG